MFNFVHSLGAISSLDDSLSGDIVIFIMIKTLELNVITKNLYIKKYL